MAVVPASAKASVRPLSSLGTVIPLLTTHRMVFVAPFPASGGTPLFKSQDKPASTDRLWPLRSQSGRRVSQGHGWDAFLVSGCVRSAYGVDSRVIWYRSDPVKGHLVQAILVRISGTNRPKSLRTPEPMATPAARLPCDPHFPDTYSLLRSEQEQELLETEPPLSRSEEFLEKRFQLGRNAPAVLQSRLHSPRKANNPTTFRKRCDPKRLVLPYLPAGAPTPLCRGSQGDGIASVVERFQAEHSLV